MLSFFVLADVPFVDVPEDEVIADVSDVDSHAKDDPTPSTSGQKRLEFSDKSDRMQRYDVKRLKSEVSPDHLKATTLALLREKKHYSAAFVLESIWDDPELANSLRDTIKARNSPKGEPVDPLDCLSLFFERNQSVQDYRVYQQVPSVDFSPKLLNLPKWLIPHRDRLFGTPKPKYEQLFSSSNFGRNFEKT